ncbi:unnamed protein product [Arabis nemorensis]|uniref:Jacalin-type lectin domain-containing protein n=1 Tax=Arabis nemorensis TaxID=586526 RepID=A0A565AWE3_9BRAS|nr:unnamed protein product [Arabis nemorensis]
MSKEETVSSKGKEPYGCISGVNYGTRLAPPAKKLKAQGGGFGYDWDDGVNDNVRMITVTYDGSGVNTVKFEYALGTNTVVGDKHGYSPSDDQKKEFRLKVDEYITSVEGHYGQRLPPPGPDRTTMKAFGYESMTMLNFKTNITTYKVLDIKPGYEYVGTPIKLTEEGHKIVGFYGMYSTCVNQIGVYVKPIGDA